MKSLADLIFTLNITVIVKVCMECCSSDTIIKHTFTLHKLKPHEPVYLYYFSNSNIIKLKK